MSNTLSISKKKDIEALTVIPVGRIDTTTAPEFEKETRADLEGVKKLTLDFKDVEYISSSGLRVLLSLHKSMMSAGGDLIISKPTEIVKEVFEVTGFTDMLNIQG